MRKAALFVAFLIFAPAVVASAQTHPTFLGSKDQCLTALASGHFTPYTPKFFGLKGVGQVNNTTTKVAPIEANACVLMLTTNGKQWVVQLDGTVFRWNVNPDGSLGTPYALDICGNPAYEIAYVSAPPPPAPLPVVVTTTPTPTPPTPININIAVEDEEEEEAPAKTVRCRKVWRKGRFGLRQYLHEECAGEDKVIASGFTTGAKFTGGIGAAVLIEEAIRNCWIIIRGR